MIVTIIGLLIGLLVLGAGIYYLVKEKEDPELCFLIASEKNLCYSSHN